MSDQIWESGDIFPGEMADSHRAISVDVLAWDPDNDQHHVAWYDYTDHTWENAQGELLEKGRILWRYFEDKTDRP